MSTASGYAGLRSISVILVMLAVLGATPPARAITWCFDWTMYHLTHQDHNRSGPADIRNACKVNGYQLAMTGVAVPRAGVDRLGKGLRAEDVKIMWALKPGVTSTDLKDGDIVLIGQQHAGFVVGNEGKIEHLLQPPGTPGTAMTPVQAPKSPNFHPASDGWTLEKFFIFEREGKANSGESPQYPHPYLGDRFEIYRRLDSLGGSKTFTVVPGKWTYTGIKLKAGDRLSASVIGEIYDDREWSCGPGGYSHLGFRAYCAKAKVGKQYIDFGSGGAISAREDGEILLGITYAYEPDPAGADANKSGEMYFTLTGPMIPIVDQAPGVPPQIFQKGSGSPLSFFIGCPVVAELKDAAGNRAFVSPDAGLRNEIPETALLAWPDGAGGYEWTGQLASGQYTLTITGTARGKMQVRTRIKDTPVSYPAVDIDQGTVFTLKLSDKDKPQPLAAGGQQIQPTARGKPADQALPGTGNQPNGNSANLTVVRTFTHHQLTAIPRGVRAPSPVISANGTRVAFVANPAGNEPARLCVVDFAGGNVTELEPFQDAYGLHINWDGRYVTYCNSTQLRLTDTRTGEKRTVLQIDEPVLNSPRLTADGSAVYVTVGRDCGQIRDNKRIQTLEAGIYRVDRSGENLKRIAGRKEIASVCGIRPEEAGPNFGAGGIAHMEISGNGTRFVFATAARDHMVILASDADGAGLRQILQADPNRVITSVGLSGNGNIVGYHMNGPDEIGVIGFDGKNPRVLSRGDLRFAYGVTEPLYLTFDGTLLLRMGRCFRTDGSAQFQVMASAGDELLRYSEYEKPAMDASGTRFIYWPSWTKVGNLQLATAELNCRLDQLRGAPRLDELAIDPAAIPRRGNPAQSTTVSVRPKIDPGHTARNVGCLALKEGIFDPLITGTLLHDDGRLEGDGPSRDKVRGDGIFTSWYTVADPSAPDGPRTLRVDAQSIDGNGMLHGQVVEIGCLPIVGQLPTGASTVNTAPPAQLPQVPKDPPKPGETVIIQPPPSTPGDPSATIDLTGFWQDQDGRPYAIRQMGNTVYWSLDALPQVHEVFRGTLDGRTLTGEWANLPGGQWNIGAGTLRLNIESNNRMTQIDSRPSVGPVYGGKIFVRR